MEAGDFPPLQNPSILGTPPVNNDVSYAKNLATSSTIPVVFPVEYVKPSQKLSFVEDDLSEGRNIWSLSLVGYSLGPRPYYERLLAAMKKVWNVKVYYIWRERNNRRFNGNGSSPDELSKAIRSDIGFKARRWKDHVQILSKFEGARMAE